MKKLKKLTALMLSAAMIICCFAIHTAAAGPFDFAKTLKPLAYVSDVLNDNQTEVVYKITLSSKGKIKFHCTDRYSSSWPASNPVCELLDANGTVISTGNAWGDTQISEMVERDFNIPKKGVYYWKIRKVLHDVYWNNMYYTFTPDENPNVSIVINLKVGQSITLSTEKENYDGAIVWESTKSSVASVSNGTVKAKKAGTAKIQAIMSNGNYEEITVVVKKK